MHRTLDFQADRIEAVLAAHRVNARVAGGVVSPRLVRFRLLPAIGTRINAIARLSEEIALSLGVPSCRIHRHGSFLEVEVPRPSPATVRLLPLCQRLHQVPPATPVLGLDEDGTPLLVHLPSPQAPHLLIAGTTGSGKTALARTMILSLALHNSLAEVSLVLIDPRQRGYAPLANLPHLSRPLASDILQAMATLTWLVGEMERRDHNGVQWPRLVVFIDELADLMQVGGREVEGYLTRLTQRGRGAGVHIVACTQKPTAKAIGSLVKSNFPVRAVGSVVSPEDARVATGMAGSGAEKLLGRGDFLLAVKGQLHRFQAAYVDEAEMEAEVARLRSGAVTRHRPRAATGTEGAMPSGLRDRVTAHLRRVK